MDPDTLIGLASLAASPRPVEFGVKTGADRRAAERHEARLAGAAEIGRAGAQEAMINAIAP